MQFSVNGTFLYLIAICVIVFVLAQSIFFLIRAYRRGKLPAVYYKPGTDLSALLADVLDDDTLKVEGVQ